MTGRSAILDRVRRAANNVLRDEAAVERRMKDRPQNAPIPEQARRTRDDPAARLDQFEEKAKAADATVSRIASWDDLPASIARELRDRNLPAALRSGTDPAFDRDWGQIERTIGEGRMEEPVTLSRAWLGCAETGTLLLMSGADNPVTLTFLGETHVVAVEAKDIHAGFEEMWAAWRDLGHDSRTVNLVTGPSRSADIGQTLQLGAHGPVALHIVIIGEP